MKYYFFQSRIEEEFVIQLCEFLNENLDDVTVYFESQGGRIGCGEVLIDIFNSRPNINLIATIEVASTAFYVFLKSKCKRKVLDGTRGLWHLGGLSIELSANKRGTYPIDQFLLSDMPKREMQQSDEFCKSLKMSEKDIKKIKRGEDVWFNTEQLREFLAITEEVV